MSKPKLTPWYAANSGVKPVRKGFYIASVGRNTFYRYWNGRWWSRGGYDLQTAAQGADRRYKFGGAKVQSEISWRGLAQEPKCQN